MCDRGRPRSAPWALRPCRAVPLPELVVVGAGRAASEHGDRLRVGVKGHRGASPRSRCSAVENPSNPCTIEGPCLRARSAPGHATEGDEPSTGLVPGDGRLGPRRRRGPRVDEFPATIPERPEVIEQGGRSGRTPEKHRGLARWTPCEPMPGSCGRRPSHEELGPIRWSNARPATIGDLDPLVRSRAEDVAQPGGIARAHAKSRHWAGRASHPTVVGQTAEKAERPAEVVQRRALEW